jgi:hypothetical protein
MLNATKAMSDLELKNALEIVSGALMLELAFRGYKVVLVPSKLKAMDSGVLRRLEFEFKRNR